MKKLAFILLLFTPLFSIAQRIFKFTLVDSATNKPLAKRWCTIIKNNEKYIDFTSTDADGVCAFSIRNYDSKATYQVEIVNRWGNGIKPGIHDITAVKYSQPEVKVITTKESMPYGCGTIMYGIYTKEPYSLEELPVNIQNKVKSYLINRVGDAFYKKLILNGGQILDVEKFYKSNPKAKENNWKPATYSLCFMVWDSVKHISLYNFSLNLDENGKLKGLVELPDIKRYPQKGKIMTLDETVEIAKKNDFYNASTQTDIYYYPQTDSIIWQFRQDGPGPGKTKSVRLHIDAQSGKVIDKVTEDIVIMY